MTRIQLQTFIRASPDRCFDLSRNIDLHQSLMKKSNEKAIAGKVNGLIETRGISDLGGNAFFCQAKVIKSHYRDEKT